MAFSVSRRTKELGIRVALGANAQDVIRLVVREGALQIALGLVIGLALALATSKVVTFALFGVPPRDPAVFGVVIGIVLAVGLGAIYLPAHRATSIDPIEALRVE